VSWDCLLPEMAGLICHKQRLNKLPRLGRCEVHMKITSLLASTIILSFATAPLALAQTAATPDATKPAAMSDDAKKAKSKECSTEADAKGLHGKERKKFREACKHGK